MKYHIESDKYKTRLTTNSGMAIIMAPKSEIDEDTLDRVYRLTHYPDIQSHIAIMPDFHIQGDGLNGIVIPTQELLYIDAIGGDIGCGVSSIEIPYTCTKPRQIFEMMHEIIIDRKFRNLNSEDELFKYESEVINRTARHNAIRQVGTLGKGNHFLEVQETPEGHMNIMVHSGSRGLGQHIKESYKRYADPHYGSIEANSWKGRAYLADMEFALHFARHNRKELLKTAVAVISGVENQHVSFDTAYITDVPHNFIIKEHETYIHRKGSISAHPDEPGIILGTMATPSYFVEGRGSFESLDSASHGAGRVMPRGKAKATLSRKDVEKSLEDVVSRKDILEEAPQAYKDIGLIMRYQRELVKQVKVLTPIINLREV